MRGPRLASGFTLLELLLAVGIFSIVSVMAYGGLRTVLDASHGVERQGEQLRRLQSAVGFLERDLRQFIERPVRDAFGQTLPAIAGAPQYGVRLSLTRAGYTNPAALPRSSLQRIDYTLDAGDLVRHSWVVLDRAQDSEPYHSTLLEEVSLFETRFLTDADTWSDQWPPAEAALSGAPTGTPRAVEVILETKTWGRIRRLIRLPQGGTA